MSPIIAATAAVKMGNWKLIFPFYGAVTLVSAVWLMLTPIEREAKDHMDTTFKGCLALLKNPYTLAMFTGILFVVGVDVGMGFSIPPYLQRVCRLDLNQAAMGPTVYFVAKTIGSFLGALILAKFSPSKCLPVSAFIALAGTIAMLFFKEAGLVLTCVFIASLGLREYFRHGFRSGHEPASGTRQCDFRPDGDGDRRRRNYSSDHGRRAECRRPERPHLCTHRLHTLPGRSGPVCRTKHR